MSIGFILAFLVLAIVVVALVFAAAAPAWLPLVLTGMLALAILTGGIMVPWRQA